MYECPRNKAYLAKLASKLLLNTGKGDDFYENPQAYFADFPEAGVVCRRVNPSYTSQNCSDCGHRNSLKLSDRLFKCTCCNFETTRDHNAAINIKTLGLQGLANSLEANVL